MVFETFKLAGGKNESQTALKVQMKQIKAGEHPKVIALRQISRTETARTKIKTTLKFDYY